MKKALLNCAIAGIVTLVGSIGFSATAFANGWDGPRGQRYERDYRGRHYAPPPRRPMCSPRLAEEKASRMGLRRARVVDVSPRRVVVAGFDRYGRERITFANAPGCPVIRR